MRKISDLKAEEFPGVDAIKFAEWKVMQELNEGAAQTIEVTVIGGHVVSIHIGYHGQHWLQIEK